MESFFGRYKNILVLVLVLLAQVIGLAVQVRRPANGQQGFQDGRQVRLLRYWVVSIVSPPEKAFHFFGSGIRGLWSGYIDLRNTRQQNQELKAEINRLRFEQAALLEDAKQGQRLQSLLSFREHYVYQTVPAQVIGTSGTDNSRVLYIDKGSKDGLKPDQPVITPDGIVGKIRDVFPNTAQVLEVNDQSSGAGVILETTRIRGILRGNVAGQPQIINILPDDRIKPGERVLTSGGDQVFPRGLSVGVVDRVVRDPDREPYIDVLIRPSANLSRLEEVLVITSVGEQMPPAQQKDMELSQQQQSGAVALDKERKRASEVLAERLPSLKDPNAPATEQETPEGQTLDTSRPARPLPTMHPDRFSPSAVPPASQLSPGQSAAHRAAPPTSSTSPSTGQGAAKPAAPGTGQPHPPATPGTTPAKKPSVPPGTTTTEPKKPVPSERPQRQPGTTPQESAPRTTSPQGGNH